MSDFHFDEGKVRVDLLPVPALMGAAKAFTYGVEKYGDRNWEEHADDWKWGQLVGSLLRHVWKWAWREDLDDESGLHHLDHALACLMMLATLVKTGRGEDDRSRLGVGAAEVIWSLGYRRVDVVSSDESDAYGNVAVGPWKRGKAYVACKECERNPVEDYQDYCRECLDDIRREEWKDI